MISNEQEIKAAASIEDVVGSFIDIKKKGSNLMGLCPFHSERTPSFSVSPTKGIFKCFGCGQGGDSVTFVREFLKLDYREALLWLAKRYNIQPIEDDKTSPAEFGEIEQYKVTASVVQAHFAANPGADKYWASRGLMQETIDEFGLGYCDGSKPPLVPDSDLAQVGLLNDKGNIIFYKRAIIPLHDRRGNVVGWAGRALEANKIKYINSPNTALYNKSGHLFNLHRAARHIKASGEVWIVEGYADVMAAWQKGISNCVALCGTALTDAHVQQLKKFNGETPLKVVLALDNETTKTDDEDAKNFKVQVALAYYNALERLLPLGEVVRMVYPLSTKRYKDIGELVQSGKDPKDLEQVDALSDYVERKLLQDEFWKRANPVKKADFQEHVARLLSLVSRDSVRDVYIKEMSNQLEITAKQFNELVAKYGVKDSEVAYDILEYEYIIVKDEFRQRYPEFSPTGEIVWRYQTLKKSTITDQFGTAFIKTIPRFTKSIVEPDHLNYQRTFVKETEYGSYRYFNDYEPLPFNPKAFDFPTGLIDNPYSFDYAEIPQIKNVARLMKHIFSNGLNPMGDEYLQIAWDWFALLYLKPRERLPAIGVVSKEEGTGKSTIINVFAKFFGANATKIDSSRIAAKFNALMGGKVLAYCEETKDDRGIMENVLKDLITGYEAVIERKFGDAEVMETFCKFFFASNHPDTFMKIGSKSTRFFVNEVRSIGEKIENFEELCYMELPYLAYFLQRRGIMLPKEDRLWFKPERYENEALLRLREASKDNVERNLEEMMEMVFVGLKHTQPYLSFTSRELMTMMITYGGRKYESNTVNYFQDVATRMGIKYTASTRRATIKVEGLYSGEISGKQNTPMPGRFLEFPIWRFVKPETIQEIYNEREILELLSNLEKLEERAPGTVPADFMGFFADVLVKPMF